MGNPYSRGSISVALTIAVMPGEQSIHDFIKKSITANRYDAGCLFLLELAGNFLGVSSVFRPMNSIRPDTTTCTFKNMPEFSGSAVA